ncbi:hypothetical protein [Streptomyces rimosus]|uniref:hypothetical protein n=1 Tax=Streptomyces rimosus TaxID=1927 RepID=UPI00223FCA49|nr:hypothetical protein [Streptomyces rimosus]
MIGIPVLTQFRAANLAAPLGQGEQHLPLILSEKPSGITLGHYISALHRMTLKQRIRSHFGTERTEIV